MIRFSFDGDSTVFTAHGAGPHWNGWLCPILDADTLKAVVARLADLSDDRIVDLAFTDTIATITEYGRNSDGSRSVELCTFTAAPDTDGHYLLDFGLTLYQI